MENQIFQCKCGYACSRLPIGKDSLHFSLRECEECGERMNRITDPEEIEKIMSIIFPNK